MALWSTTWLCCWVKKVGESLKIGKGSEKDRKNYIIVKKFMTGTCTPPTRPPASASAAPRTTPSSAPPSILKMSTTSTKFRQHAKNFQNLLSRCKQNQKLLDKMTITFGAHLFDSFSQVWKPFNIPLNKTLHCYWRHLHSCPFTFYGWVHNAYCPRPCLFGHAKFPEA